MRTFCIATVLCVITLLGSACSRHTARAVRVPGDAAGAQKRGLQRGDAAKGVREAIQSLKERMGRGGAEDTAIAGGGSVTVTPPPSGPGSVPPSVGTSGATSVETRYPADPAGGGAQPTTQGRGHLLSRAGAAVRGATGGSWLGIAALFLIAGVVVWVLSLRRHRTEA